MHIHRNSTKDKCTLLWFSVWYKWVDPFNSVKTTHQLLSFQSYCKHKIRLKFANSKIHKADLNNQYDCKKTRILHSLLFLLNLKSQWFCGDLFSWSRRIVGREALSWNAESWIFSEFAKVYSYEKFIFFHSRKSVLPKNLNDSLTFHGNKPLTIFMRKKIYRNNESFC